MSMSCDQTVNMAATCQVVYVISLFVFVSLSQADDNKASAIVRYDKDTFQNAIGSKKHFIMFFAPWCKHCQQLAPAWKNLIKEYNNEDSPVTVAAVDCTKERALCSEQKVNSYPTLRFFHKNANDYQRYKYKENIDLNSLKTFMEEAASQTISDRCLPLDGHQDLVELTDDTFENAIREGCHFIQFYAPWCGHCKQLAPTWKKLATSGSKHVSISSVDCTLSPKLCADQGVKIYPMLILFKNGDKVEEYKGIHSYGDLKDFVNKNVREEDPVVDLTFENYEDVTAAGSTFVNFFAPWCGHCKSLAHTWTKLGQASEGKDVTIARVDCAKYLAICEAEWIKSYPTLFMFDKGKQLEYKGQLHQNALQGFIEEVLKGLHER